MTDEVVCVLEAHALLGECPVWCPREKALYWLDIWSSVLHRFDPASGEDRIFPPPDALVKWDQPVASFALRERGGFVMARRDGFAFFDPQAGFGRAGESGAIQVISEVERDLPENRFNDGKCDRRGRFWAGSYNLANQPLGSFYRLDADLSVHRMDTGITIANGLGWSPDDKRMYYADTATARIDVYEYDIATGGIANLRVFVDLPKEVGVPDGLTSSTGGSGATTPTARGRSAFPTASTVDVLYRVSIVWCTLPGAGGRIRRYDPDGRVERMIEVPVPGPTSCIFGGEDLDVLYITTERYLLTPQELAESPHSGDVLALEPGVKGLPEPRFAG